MSSIEQQLDQMLNERKRGGDLVSTLIKTKEFAKDLETNSMDPVEFMKIAIDHAAARIEPSYELAITLNDFKFAFMQMKSRAAETET